MQPTDPDFSLPFESIRGEYERHGVQGFYAGHGADYRNPHEYAIGEALERIVRDWPFDWSDVLDLACGSGEVTLALRRLGCTGPITGVDPFTGEAYLTRTGQIAEPYTFEDIGAGALTGRRYSLIVSSFALHLVEPSRLPVLAYQLGQLAPSMLILTPHKRPHLEAAWGWQLIHEMVVDRVRARLYTSTLFDLSLAEHVNKKD